jgi:histidinol-phosphate aminotransferase
MKRIRDLIRPGIRELKSYSSARDTFNENGFIYMDANENPFGTNLNRYPDPLQWDLKKTIARLFNSKKENLFLGNGSDEILDLVIRVFCNPGMDNIVTIDPSYGMYKVLANINGVELREVQLNSIFDLDADALLNKCDDHTKLIILCSPNNPTGNLLNELEIYRILNTFNGMLLIDEAYIEFSGYKGFYDKIRQFPNLIVLRTFSKAWGLAGIRLGYAFASEEIVGFLNKVKAPYNVNRLTQQKALRALEKRKKFSRMIDRLIRERERLGPKLSKYPFVKKVYPSQTNYFLVEVDEPCSLSAFLKERRLIVRDRSGITHCDRCIRITIGTKKQNEKLLRALDAYESRYREREEISQSERT